MMYDPICCFVYLHCRFETLVSKQLITCLFIQEIVHWPMLSRAIGRPNTVASNGEHFGSKINVNDIWLGYMYLQGLPVSCPISQE